MRELCEDMMDALENCYLQMHTAGLGYATRSLEAQIETFKERMSAFDESGIEKIGAIERDGIDGDESVRVWPVVEMTIEEQQNPIPYMGPILTITATCDEKGAYAVAIGKVK